MNTVSRVRTIWLGSVAAALAAASAFSPALRAQSQDNSQSVAEAARKAKEQKKTTTKDARVITDDTIRLRPASADSDAAPPAGTVVTSTPPAEAAAQPASSAPSDAAAPNPPAQPAPDTRKKQEQSAEVAKAKDLLAQAQAQLDVLKRELALDSDSFFSNPDYSHDSAGKAKLDDLQKTIGDKQISVEDLKQQLAALMKEAGISPDADKNPPPPQN
ncbi:MAG: hypothetical protein JSS69_02215 [Acidobacteria bacterium]|nr:hypothetical protein [Acidobacteriota bacterium]MBS1864708.1 hypothetical protein [Acidobacteriota bacterium]